jgi:hypothetical protein
MELCLLIIFTENGEKLMFFVQCCTASFLPCELSVCRLIATATEKARLRKRNLP